MERERVDEANTILRIQNEDLISEGKWNGWSIVIQVHNRLDLLKECFKSIEEVRFNIGARKMRLNRNSLRNVYTSRARQRAGRPGPKIFDPGLQNEPCIPEQYV